MAFVTGTGERYVGGVSASRGTSTKPVYDRDARPDGVPGGQGRPKAPVSSYTGPDRSRPVRLVNRRPLTNCGFPPEADVAQVNHGRVDVAVTIDAQGKVAKVSILSDPGYGMGSRARRCAQRATYAPARDRSGKAISSTITLNVKFER